MAHEARTRGLFLCNFLDTFPVFPERMTKVASTGVQRLDIVDNSISLCESISGRGVSSFNRPGRPFQPGARHTHLLSASLNRLCHVASPFLGSQQAEQRTSGKG